MHPVIPQIIGLCAVATFLLSYQQKKRSNLFRLNFGRNRLLFLGFGMRCWDANHVDSLIVNKKPIRIDCLPQRIYWPRNHNLIWYKMPLEK